MPVILKSESYDQWLDPKVKDTDRLQNLLVPYAAKEIDSHLVSRNVNIVSSDTPELIVPLNSL